MDSGDPSPMNPPNQANTNSMETRLLEAIRTTEVLSGHPRIAARLIALTRDPQADIGDYADLIQLDPSLASRLLGLVNSALFDPNAPVLTVGRAARTLGIQSLRELTLSHCVASLHLALKQGTEGASEHWRASIAKALVARKVGDCIGIRKQEALFTAGLLQDIGLALLTSLDPESIHSIRANTGWSEEQIQWAESKHFGLHHMEVGTRIAQRLELPDCYHEAINSHHVAGSFQGRDGFDLAVGISSLLPHAGCEWASLERERFDHVFNEQLSNWNTPEHFLAEIHEELAILEAALGTGSMEMEALLDGMMFASQENARSTYTTVYQNTWLREDTNSLNEALDHAERAHLAAEQARKEAQERAERDPLTQLYNRSGWDRRARASLSHSATNEGTVGVAFFDLDHFKELNDQYGHHAGDHFLKVVSKRMLESTRIDDLVCRWGGDEFVILFCDMSAEDCLEAARRVKEHIQSRPILFDGHRMDVSATVGFVSVKATADELNLGDLLQIADEQLYKAKADQRGTLSFTNAGA